MRIIVCDSCGKKVTATNRTNYLGPDETPYIVVEANWDDDNGQFCSWACLAEWAMGKAVEHRNRTEAEIHHG